MCSKAATAKSIFQEHMEDQRSLVCFALTLVCFADSKATTLSNKSIYLSSSIVAQLHRNTLKEPVRLGTS